MKDPRIVFMGSPEFSLPSLRSLAAEYNIVGVVTQPDRPAGRGLKLTPPPVKELALELGLPVFQPRKLRDQDAFDQVKAWNPDIVVLAAFGQFLPESLLDLPPFKCVNLHPSLLPRWRGAGPIQGTILSGDTMAGTTMMIMDEGMDTGPIIAQAETPLLPDDTHDSLNERLAQISADMLMDALPGYLNGTLIPQDQDDSLETLAPKVKKAQGELNIEKTAAELERLVRAFYAWPGAFMLLDGKRLKVLKAHLGTAPNGKPGQRAVIDGLPAVAAADGWLVLDLVQPEGKKAMPGDAFLRGVRNWLS
jgi:methionyl-tRNA formyltransferase